MYRLHYSPGSASFSVHWALLELGVPFELARVDLAAGEQRSARYLALNPNGTVPTLEIDGVPMTEAAAILLRLAERHPERGLAPALSARERERYLSLMLYLANTLQPAFRLWFYPDEAAGPGAIDGAKAAARARIERCFERLDAVLAQGGPYLLGAHLSVVDLHATMLLRWSRNMPKPATSWPALAAYATRMKARPSFQALYAAEGLTEWA